MTPQTASPSRTGAMNVEDYTKTMLNILEDFSDEKLRLEAMQRAAINILEDFSGEKTRLEETQRAMLNLIDDLSAEREKTDAVNRELREVENQVRKSLQEKEVLLKEIHHRVKNNLQIIHSMLNLQLPLVKDKRTIELFKDSQNRVYSMALIHEKLYQSESLAKIDLAEYIRSLTANLFLSYGINETAVRLTIQVEHVTLGVDTAIPCALVINELVTNSLKHAFPDSWRRAGGKGEITVHLHQDTGNKYTLSVRDNGAGLPPGFSVQGSESLGLKLVNVLTKQLKGAIRLDRKGGTLFEMTFEAKEGPENA